MYSVASESGFTPVVLKDLNIQKVTGHNPVESGTRGEKGVWRTYSQTT